MIKTLLLASSCVIGSGAGALQKNAPVFNHNAITNTSNETNETFTITSTDDYKNNVNTFYEYNSANEYIDFQANIETQTSRFNNAGTIQIMQTGQTNLWTYTHDTGQDLPVKSYVCVIKVTPYLNYTNGSAEIHLKFNMTNTPQGGPTYNNFEWVMTCCQNNDNDYNRYLQTQPYGQLWYPISLYDRAYKDTNSYNKETFFRSSLGTQDGLTLDTDQRDLIMYTTYNVQITNKPTFIIFGMSYFDFTDNSEDTYNRVPYLEYADIVLNRTIGTPSTYEVVDIGGIMFDILTMPFAFVSRAFNMTLFPNTAYQVNISTLFLALFAALAFIFIIKKFIKK